MSRFGISKRQAYRWINNKLKENPKWKKLFKDDKLTVDKFFSNRDRYVQGAAYNSEWEQKFHKKSIQLGIKNRRHKSWREAYLHKVLDSSLAPVEYYGGSIEKKLIEIYRSKEQINFLKSCNRFWVKPRHLPDILGASLIDSYYRSNNARNQYLWRSMQLIRDTLGIQDPTIYDLIEKYQKKTSPQNIKYVNEYIAILIER